MNKRLLAYLRSLGLDPNAGSDQAWTFFQGLRGNQRAIANNLNYVEADAQARTSCDLAIRSLGYDPEQPGQMLAAEGEGQRGGDSAGATATAIEGAEGEGQGQRSGQGIGSDGSSNQGDLEAAVRRGQAAERDRQDSIRSLAEMAGVSDEMLRTALADGLTVEQASGQFVEHHRSQRGQVPHDFGSAPAGHIRNNQTGYSAESLAAAFMLRRGVNDPTRSWPEYNRVTGQFRSRAIESSDDQLLRAIDQGDELQQLTIRDICQRALALDGVRCDATPASIMAACEQHRSAVISTSSMVGVFTQTFGALLLQGYDEAPDTTLGWTVERTNPNFLPNERVTLGKMASLTKHARGKTADLMENSDNTEFTRVKRYSGKWVADEIDLINDTFGAMQSETPGDMGASARRLRPDLVWFILLNNPNLADGFPLFRAESNNLHTGRLLNKANAEFVRAQMMLQIARPGVPIDAMPKYFAVGPSLESTLDDLLESNAIVAAGTAGANLVLPNGNNVARKGYMPVIERRLELGVTDPDTGVSEAGSAENWYVMSDKGPRSLEVTYRAGGPRSPQLRSFALTEGQWGLGFDVVMDIGAKAMNREGIARVEGS